MGAEMDRAVTQSGGPRVALIPWGTPIEAFLDPLDRTIDDFCDRLHGGWLFGYAVALSGAGYAPTIVVCSSSVQVVQRRRHAPTGTPIVVLPLSRSSLRSSPPGLRRDLWAYWHAVPRQMASELSRYDAILVQEYEEPRADVLMWWGRARRIPVLATFQGGLPPWERAPLQRLVRGPSLRGCSALLAGSEAECERLVTVRRVKPSRVHRVVNPVDVTAWTPQDRDAARRQLDISSDSLVVAWHGRVELQRKGIDVLLDAWPLVRDALPNRTLCLLLVGSGPDDEALRKLLNDSGGKDVRWLASYATADEVRLRLAACDLWVSPSRHEGFAVAPLEAMSSGRPIVVTTVPGAVELLHDAVDGVPVPPGHAPALADAIVSALSRPDWLSAAGRRCRARAEHHFSDAAVGRGLRAALTAAGLCPDPRAS
ncbi:MAG: glycosyltransferase family 4 protein [Ilumatobacter sp.]